MKAKSLNRCLYFFYSVVLLYSCTHKTSYPAVSPGNYPKDIGAIILSKCAVSGCHNALSATNAAAFNLATWDDMFKGSYSGATVIPYRPDFSTLCFFTNTYSDLGIALKPAMPFNKPPLSRAEYLKLRDWIQAGAPDAAGNIKFTGDDYRKKFYITNRLCDVVTVIDAASLLQMRYITTGGGAAKFPYCIKVAPDAKHWYVSFFSPSGFVQKFSAADDHLVGNINLGSGSWTSFEIAADSRHGWFVDNSSIGKVVYADLETGKVLATYTFGGNFKYPNGIALCEQFHKLYVGAASGNYIYTIDIANPLFPIVREQPIDGTGVVTYESSLDPVELLSVPQNNRCYIACSRSGELRVWDMEHNMLLDRISLATNPAFMSFSASAQKLFISCPDDTASFTGNRGAVVVVDAKTNAIINKINTGYQPYGLAIDEQRRIVAVVNANISSSGPASHHVSGCGSKNGNVTFIDLSTLELISNKKLEVAVFPFAAAVR